jgi:ADP-ribose pyrophosphatase YjhB (NUDIX family)
MLFNPDGALLLVRNSYGASHHFVLPGGGVRPWEQPRAAAIREVREEVGLAVTELAFVATYLSLAEGKRDTVHLFRAQTAGQPVPDGFEIAEAAFFALDALPPTLSPATARRIAEHRGDRRPASDW